MNIDMLLKGLVFSVVMNEFSVVMNEFSVVMNEYWYAVERVSV